MPRILREPLARGGPRRGRLAQPICAIEPMRCRTCTSNMCHSILREEPDKNDTTVFRARFGAPRRRHAPRPSRGSPVHPRLSTRGARPKPLGSVARALAWSCGSNALKAASIMVLRMAVTVSSHGPCVARETPVDTRSCSQPWRPDNPAARRIGRTEAGAVCLRIEGDWRSYRAPAIPGTCGACGALVK